MDQLNSIEVQKTTKEITVGRANPRYEKDSKMIISSVSVVGNDSPAASHQSMTSFGGRIPSATIFIRSFIAVVEGDQTSSGFGSGTGLLGDDIVVRQRGFDLGM